MKFNGKKIQSLKRLRNESMQYKSFTSVINSHFLFMPLYHSQEIMESAFMHLHKICMCIQHKMETLRQNVNVIYRHDCNIHQTCRSLNLPSKYGYVEKKYCKRGLL